MTFRAGFSEIDITPSPGTKKGGWMQDLDAQVVLDPLYAKSAVFESNSGRVGFIQLDLLSVRWNQVQEIRQRVERETGFPGHHIMIGATHNHAGPAIANLVPVRRQEDYVRFMVDRCVEVFRNALANLREAEAALVSRHEFGVAFNRRVVRRDGTVKTHGQFRTPEDLFFEGPVDPELAVFAVRDRQTGSPLGCLMNFACHPTHHGGTNEISAGYPGALTDRMKTIGVPVSLFLNGAYGNVHTSNPTTGAKDLKEAVADRLFSGMKEMLATGEYRENWPVGTATRTVPVRYRDFSETEMKGRVVGAQRFRSDDLYEGFIDDLKAQVEAGKRTFAEIQAIGIGEIRFVSIPGEYFVEYGLEIKEKSHPLRAFPVGGANGMIGYLPTLAAFSRGGYETTFGPPSRMARETGQELAANAVDVAKECHTT
jgi:hypothetical protein